MTSTVLRVTGSRLQIARLVHRLPLWHLAALFAAVVVGAGITHPGKPGLLVVIVGCLPLAIALAVDRPYTLFVACVTLVAVFSELPQDNSIVPGWTLVYGAAPHSAVELLLYLLLLSYLLRMAREGIDRAWPGLPATAALTIGLAGFVSSATHSGPLKPELGVLRDSTLVFVAMLCGYWLALERAPAALYRVFVLASVPMIPLGLYNYVSGAGAHGGNGDPLSFYDATSVFLLGICVLLVGFEVVQLHAWRIPYCLAATVVAVVSLRRGAMLSIAVALLVTLVWTTRSAKSSRWAWAGAIAAAAVAAEAVYPGILINHVSRLTTYLTGSSGTDWSVNYRNFERPNVWINVKHAWFNGIGPGGSWTLWNSYNGQFQPLNQQYVHNNFLWVWLHYGLYGLAALVTFLVCTAWTLLRRFEHAISTTIVGGVIVGSAVMFATASQLTTTVRWPVITGLLVGIACAQRRREALQLSEPAAA